MTPASSTDLAAAARRLREELPEPDRAALRAAVQQAMDDFREQARHWFPDGNWSVETARQAGTLGPAAQGVQHLGARITGAFRGITERARRKAFLAGAHTQQVMQKAAGVDAARSPVDVALKRESLVIEGRRVDIFREREWNPDEHPRAPAGSDAGGEFAAAGGGVGGADNDGAAAHATGPSGIAPSSQKTATPEFKAWFGDSKAVDDNGDPLVMYHGTNVDVGEFDKGTVNKRFPLSFGFHFTDRPSEASVYAHGSVDDRKPAKPGANVLPVYLKADNPLLIDTGHLTASMHADIQRQDIMDALEAARKAGRPHDSVIIRRKRGDEWDGVNIIVFDPSQIKSAFNKGTWNPKSSKLSESRRISIGGRAVDIGPDESSINEPPEPEHADRRLVARAIITEPDGRVWLYDPKDEQYVMIPGGGADPDEPLQQAAVRECLEETGLVVELVSYLADFGDAFSVRRYYLARRIGGEPTTTDADGDVPVKVRCVSREDAASMLTSEFDQCALALAMKRMQEAGWDEEKHPRGKTTDGSTPGSFAAAAVQVGITSSQDADPKSAELLAQGRELWNAGHRAEALGVWQRITQESRDELGTLLRSDGATRILEFDANTHGLYFGEPEASYWLIVRSSNEGLTLASLATFADAHKQDSFITAKPVRDKSAPLRLDLEFGENLSADDVLKIQKAVNGSGLGLTLDQRTGRAVALNIHAWDKYSPDEFADAAGSAIEAISAGGIHLVDHGIKRVSIGIYTPDEREYTTATYESLIGRRRLRREAGPPAEGARLERDAEERLHVSRLREGLSGLPQRAGSGQGQSP